MHVLLGSQTLSGAYSLARSTVGQMAVRVALQCSETDSYLILSEDNAAARLLSRPGEAIYNDANGLVEGNSPFQIAWLPDATRDEALDVARERAEAEGWRPPAPQIVFEGNVPADPAGNHLLMSHLEPDPTDRPEAPKAPRLWIGEPVAIKDPTAGLMRRQSGANLLLVGQQDETAQAMSASMLMGLAAQLAGTGARVRVIDSTPPDDPGADVLGDLARTLAEAGGLDLERVGPRDAAEVVGGVRRRAAAPRGRRVRGRPLVPADPRPATAPRSPQEGTTTSRSPSRAATTATTRAPRPINSSPTCCERGPRSACTSPRGAIPRATSPARSTAPPSASSSSGRCCR